MVVVVLLLLFIVLPLAELYVLIQVGELIGVLPTIAILIGSSVLGVALLRSQGRRAWRRLNDAVQSGRAPAREVLDGGLIVMGGALLIVPGFITDVVGLLLLAPPTRAGFRFLLARHFRSRIVTRVTSFGAGREPRREYDIEGSAYEVDPQRGRRLPPPAPPGR